MASSPSTPPPKRGTAKSRHSPAIPDTPNRLHRFLPSILFPLDRSTPPDDWISHNTRERVADLNASSIDWSHEYAKERVRLQALSELQGINGVGVRLWDSTLPWLVVAATGIGTGVLAAGLDILSAWLSDLRFGVCRDMWWMSKGVCCTGLDVGERCNAWKTWADIAAEQSHTIVRALVQYGIYILFAVVFAVTASFFIEVYAPFAFHTGIPEIKTILGGYIIVGFLSGWTLLVKAIGLPLAVASGLSLGKEGPLVHVACCIGNLLLQPFAVLRGNEARQRQILAAAAAAGVSVAFGAPLGGVLFSLEEISTFFPGSTLWQAFVCAIVAAVTLQYIDPYNTGKLVLFQVTTTNQVWRGFELIPWLFLGACGGLWGAWFIRMNEEWERLRRASEMRNWRVTEVGILALLTAVVSYLMLLMRIPTSELVANLFQDCSALDPLGLCDTSRTTSLVALLLVTAFAKTLLTAVTFGAFVPAGIFLPSLAIGACVGRAVGVVMASWQRAHPAAWVFANCPADGACISPAVYAVIGAASALGGVTRMTISLVVIMFELTGAVDLVLQIMMAVMVSKFTGDYFSKDRNGIYEAWINLRNYPFISNKTEYRRDTIIAKEVMTPVKDLCLLSDEGWTLSRLEALLETEEYRGYPIVRTLSDRVVLGYISKLELQSAMDLIRIAQGVTPSTPCFFTSSSTRGPQIGPLASEPSSLKTDNLDVSPRPNGDGLASAFSGDAGQESWVSLKPWIDQTPLSLNLETPMEIVVQMFRRLGLRSMLFTRRGVLAGILTKMDLHAHLHPQPGEVVRRIKPRSKSTTGLRERARRQDRPLMREEPHEELGLMDDVSTAGSRRTSWGI